MIPSRPSQHDWFASYVLLYAVMAVVLGLLLWQGSRRSVFVGDPSQVRETSSGHAELIGQIDPNVAPWHDMSLLPRMGAKVSRRIVAFRKARQIEWQNAHPDRSLKDAPPVFTKAADLLSVKGIGPKMLERIRPYLLFPDEGASTSPTKQTP